MISRLILSLRLLRMDGVCMGKVLSKELTSYDLLKCVAVIIMIIDHVGYYFYPDILWFRAIGRIGFPVWFFLIGHSTGRDMSVVFLGGAAALTGMNFVAGMDILPLNALVTIMCIRLILDETMRQMLVNKAAFIGLLIMMFFLIIPTGIFVEYGTQALILAVFGYVVRHRPEVSGFKSPKDVITLAMVISLMSFVIMQQMMFMFDMAEMLFMGTGTLIFCMILQSFKPISFPALTQKVPGVVRWFIQFCGRRTLEIYIVHLLLFKAAMMIIMPEAYGFMEWSWLPEK